MFKLLLKIAFLFLSIPLDNCFAFVVERRFIFRGITSRKATISESYDTELMKKYKRVFVAGGSRGVGRKIIDKLTSVGVDVVTLLRSEETIAEFSAFDHVTAIHGDAFNYKAVEGAMDGCDAVITTLGGDVTNDGKRVDYEGNSNVIEAAGVLGITRLVLVTSIGCGSSKDAPPPSVYEVLKDQLAAKERAENVLIKYYTNMNWTIIRPGGLKSDPMTGTAILTEDTKAIGSISREDVSDLVLRALAAKNTERKVLSAIDPPISGSSVTFDTFVLS